MPDAILKQGSEAAPALPGSARAASLAPAPALLEPEWKAKRKQQGEGEAAEAEGGRLGVF